MFFLGIAALNPDRDPVKEKHPNTFRGMVKLDCVSQGANIPSKNRKIKS